jgi:uncharacterized protein HemX
MNEQEKKVVEDISNSQPVTWFGGILKKIKGRVLIYVILGLALGIGVWYYVATRPPAINRETTEKNEVLQGRIDSLLEKNKALEARTLVLEQKAAEQNAKVEKNNAQIQKNLTELDKIKKQFNEKITAVDNYTSSDIDSFFTNRYN